MDERPYLGIYPEGEAAFVAVLEALLQRHHLLEQSGVDRQRCDCREQPAVVCREAQVLLKRQLKSHPCDLVTQVVVFFKCFAFGRTRADLLSFPWRISKRVAPFTMKLGEEQSS